MKELARKGGCIFSCASPAYLERHGTPQRLDDLEGHRLVHYVPTFGSKPDGWEYWGGAAYVSRPMAGALTVNSAEAYEAACIAGLGLIQVPLAGVRHHIAPDKLVESCRSTQPNRCRCRCCMRIAATCRCGCRRSWRGSRRSCDRTWRAMGRRPRTSNPRSTGELLLAEAGALP